MPEIATQREDLRALTGLHLWHAGLSNCSQRVRLVLEEKGLAWTSHLIDLFRFEHATAEYQSLHPKGLVPALIHEGRTVIDSNDIIAYLDRCFPEPPLGAPGPSAERLMALAADNQLCLRTVSHELLLGEHRRLDPKALARLERTHRNSELAAFFRQFSTDGFSNSRLLECIRDLDSALDVLDAHLDHHAWLGGEAISIVDFSWLPNLHRFALFDLPLEGHPNVIGWFERMKGRSSYRAALLDYERDLPTVSPAGRVRRQALFAQAGI